VQIALRERDRDAGLLQRVVDAVGGVALDRQPVVEVRRPEPQLKVERAVAEALEEHVGRRVLEAAGNGLHRVEQDLLHLVRVRPVCHADLDLNPSQPV